MLRPSSRLITAAQGGMTALLWAAQNGHHECLVALNAAGADCNVKEEVLCFAIPTPCLRAFVFYVI